MSERICPKIEIKNPSKPWTPPLKDFTNRIDELEKEIADLKAKNKRLGKALKWYIKEDDTGFSEDNKYFLAGKKRAEKAIAENREKK